MQRGPGGIALVLAVFGSACSMLVSFDDLRFDGPSQNGPPALVYVSVTTGDDANDGRSPSTPKKSVTEALKVAKSVGGLVEVRVCEGSYGEPSLRIDFDVVLSGGYDCAAFAPSMRNTVLENTDGPGGPRATVDLIGSSVTGATVVEGFVIRGAAAGEGDSIAVRVSNGAAPKLRENVIEGGAGSGTQDAGSIGVLVDNAAAEIDHNTIDGGVGVGNGTNAGSIGIYAIDSEVFAHDNNPIEGGAGSNVGENHFSVGVFCKSATLTFEANTIDGGTGVGTGDPSTPSTVGIVADSCELDSTRDTIGGGSSPTQPGGAYGVFAGKQGARVHIRQGRIHVVQGDGMHSIAAAHAIGVLTGNELELTNNMIMSVVNAGTGIVTGITGVIVLGIPQPVIRHNTIFVDCAQGGCDAHAVRIHLASAGAIIEDNLLFGRGQDAGHAVNGVYADDEGSVASLKGNAVFGLAGAYMNAMNGWTYFGSAEMQASFVSGTASDNKELMDDCSAAPSSCVLEPGCYNPPGCADRIFAGWSADDLGQSGLILDGWKLRDDPPCALAESGHDDTSSVPVDHYDETRTSAPSVGAHEYNGACH
jgi:hypothetical protein